MTGDAGVRPVASRPTRSAIRILVVDPHPVVRSGIAAIVADQPGMRLVAEARDGQEAIDLCLSHRPDVTLMEIPLPVVGGIEAAQAIRLAWAEARILMLTACAGHTHFRQALRAGVRGYLCKSASQRELVDTIRGVHDGRKVVPAALASELATRGAEAELSPREVEVLRLVAQGSSNKRIALLLGVSLDTIKAHLRGIMNKLDARDRTHAVTSAYRLGLLELFD